MAIVSLPCRECGSDRPFRLVSSCEIDRKPKKRFRQFNRLVSTLAVCEICKFPIVIISAAAYNEVTQGKTPDNFDGNPFSDQNPFKRTLFELLDFNPQIKKLHAPADTPLNIRSAFLEALSTQEAGHTGLAGVGFRRALERSTKALSPRKPKESLHGHIKRLVQENVLHPTLAEWADEIRLIGNDAAHEEEDPTREDVEEISRFTEMFLTYAFTMPAKLMRLRGEEDGA